MESEILKAWQKVLSEDLSKENEKNPHKENSFLSWIPLEMVLITEELSLGKQKLTYTPRIDDTLPQDNLSFEELLRRIIGH